MEVQQILDEIDHQLRQLTEKWKESDNTREISHIISMSESLNKLRKWILDHVEPKSLYKYKNYG